MLCNNAGDTPTLITLGTCNVSRFVTPYKGASLLRHGLPEHAAESEGAQGHTNDDAAIGMICQRPLST